jgi:tetratricopeptide (TPR) repeat protein
MIEAPIQAGTLLRELVALPGGDRAARVRAQGPAEAVLAALGEEAERLAVSDLGAAMAVTECLPALADAMGAGAARSSVRRARAHVLCNAGRLEEGRLLCDEAARLAEEGGWPVEAGRARMRSMQALGELGRFDESIVAGEAARAAFLRAGRDDLAARADANLGIVFQRRDQPDRALEAFDRARPRIGDSPFAIGTVENGRGEALLALNEFARARAAFESALEQYERAGATMVAAVAEGNLADLAARHGALPGAIYHFERARRGFEATASSGHLARLLAEQAEAIEVLGLPEEALALYESALPQLDRGGQALEAARARSGLGRTLLRLGRRSEARTALAAAAAAFEDLGHRTARARVDLLRAELAAADGQGPEARRLVHAALAVLHDRPADAAAARHLLARLALEEGTLDEAEAELGAAMAVARRLDLAPLLADLLHTAGRLRRRQGRLPAAVRDLGAAAAQVERVRSSMQAQRFRAAWLGDRLAVYEDLMLALLDMGGDEAAPRAFDVAERARSRSLLELLRGAVEARADEPDAGPGEQALAADHARCRARMEALYSRLADDVRGPGGAAWQREVIELETRIEGIESRLAAARGGAGLFARPSTFEEIAAALAPGTTLIEYVCAGGEVSAFVVSGGRLVVVRGLAGSGLLEERLNRLQFQVNRALRPGARAGARARGLLEDAQAELGALDAMLMAPLRPHLPAGDRLLIVPHGALHMLPFHALRDGARYLVERHEIHCAPSASIHAQLRGRAVHGAAGRGALAVGVGDEAAPHMGAEAGRIAAHLPAPVRVLSGGAATAAAVCAAAPGADVVHLACHARFEPAAPFASGLRLADRWLTVRDVLRLRLDARLVTLSGCETGRALVHSGDEIVGLVRGVLAAGASSVLVALWRVEDEPAARMMAGLYEDLKAGAGRAGALRRAQLRAMERDPHPASWAPFVLIGET